MPKVTAWITTPTVHDVEVPDKFLPIIQKANSGEPFTEADWEWRNELYKYVALEFPEAEVINVDTFEGREIIWA